ncbi:MAG: hypothetical protein KGM49_05900 [Sphingomonadales bacterium]|nr:hypothetical protein [Sphingomonadales bacterium]
MRRAMILTALALATVPLAGCASDYGHGYNRPVAYSNYYPRSYGWYDGYYGPIFDGYWGNGGYYYYRMHDRDRWRRDGDRHFRQGATSPGERWEHFDRAPPAWRGHGSGRGPGRGHGERHGHGGHHRNRN